jgi:hypothetical protein
MCQQILINPHDIKFNEASFNDSRVASYVQTDGRSYCNRCSGIMGKQIRINTAIKSSSFWKITSCSPLKVYRRFEGTCRLHLHGWRVRYSRNQQPCLLLHAGFLPGLLLNPEDRGDIFNWNLGWLSTDYLALCPKRQPPPWTLGILRSSIID